MLGAINRYFSYSVNLVGLQDMPNRTLGLKGNSQIGQSWAPPRDKLPLPRILGGGKNGSAKKKTGRHHAADCRQGCGPMGTVSHMINSTAGCGNRSVGGCWKRYANRITGSVCWPGETASQRYLADSAQTAQLGGTSRVRPEGWQRVTPSCQAFQVESETLLRVIYRFESR